MTAAEHAVLLARPPLWVCTKCGYCGSEGPDHMRSDGEACRYMPSNTRALEHRLVAELTRSREALLAAAPAIDQLVAHQNQLDEHGVMVGVSRQAVDEVVAAFRAALGEEPADGDTERR